MRSTIYDEIGGEQTVGAVVDILYERLLADGDLMRYFDGRDMTGLKAHQRALIGVALGATQEQYQGRMMHPAHAGLAVTDEAFDRVLDHLLAALGEAGVPAATSARIVAMLQPLRTDVVQAAVAARR